MWLRAYVPHGELSIPSVPLPSCNAVMKDVQNLLAQTVIIEIISRCSKDITELAKNMVPGSGRIMHPVWNLFESTGTALDSPQKIPCIIAFNQDEKRHKISSADGISR